MLCKKFLQQIYNTRYMKIEHDYVVVKFPSFLVQEAIIKTKIIKLMKKRLFKLGYDKLVLHRLYFLYVFTLKINKRKFFKFNSIFIDGKKRDCYIVK